MPRRISIILALLVAMAGSPRWSQAEDLRLGLPDDIQFAVRVNLPAVQSSTVGSRLLAFAKEEMLGKLADKAEGKGLTQEKIVEIVGFDPFEEVQNVVIAAADYEAPESSLAMCIQLRKTAGNLEGLLLALPGYSVEAYGNHQIHSVAPEGGLPFHCAFHTDDAGSRTVLLAARRDAIVQMLDSLAGKAGSDASARTVTLASQESPLAVVDMFKLPPQMMDQEGPPANVAKIVRSLSVRVGESDGKVHVATSIVADSEKQSEQLEQMVKGLAAMVSLASSADAEDDDLKMVQKYLSDLTVKRSGSAVELSLSVPAADVQKLIEENLLDK